MADPDDPCPEVSASYRRLAAELPDYFNNPDPEGLVILTGEEELRRAEAEIAGRLAASGLPRDWARAGVLYEDAWIYCLRDVVRFPDGRLGTHHRIIHKDGPQSVAILPRWQDRLVLLRHFRHGLRDWALEFPRGGGERDRPAEKVAQEELREELGAEIISLRPLGLVFPQNNLMRTHLRLFFAEISGFGSANKAEGIAEVRTVTVAELERLIDSDVVAEFNVPWRFSHGRVSGVCCERE